MSQTTKAQFYRYTLRTSALAQWDMCTNKVMAYIYPPDNALSIENLSCHFKMTFDSAISSGARVLSKIGICSEVPASVGEVPRYINTIVLNQAANGSLEVEIDIDLTSLLRKTDVNLETDFIGDFLQNNMTMVYVELPESLQAENFVGVINLWKIDALFTTKEIR